MESTWWEPVKAYSPSEAQKEVEGRLSKTGSVNTDYAKIQEAYKQSQMVETQDNLARKLGVLPPMSSEMIQNSQDYRSYMDSSLQNEPMSKQGYFGGPVLPSAAQGGIPPYTDPLNSQTRWGIPTWREEMDEGAKREVQQQARSWCRWYYHNHPVVPTCIDIYAKYPFVGLDLQCPDPSVEEEYKSIFFDILNYEDKLPEAALHYWINGETGLLGQWDENYKAWVDEQIINSDNIEVMSWPGPTGPAASKEAFFWYPPVDLQQLLKDQDMEDPRFQYMLDTFGEELMMWVDGNPSELPRDVFSLLKFRSDLGGNRGYPILMRAFGHLMMEEKLNQAMTAVADRLYTPFIIAKLGSKDLLAGGLPWMPTPEQMRAMQAHLEMVMISKYRLMVYHSGIEFENPFAGQMIPDLNGDFDRITEKILNVFGISKELIMGGGHGTYASGALSAEIMMQQLSTHQQQWSRWWLVERAKKVAEARGYYQLERKGNTFIKPMERVRQWNPRTMEMEIRERRKLMLPSIRMETMDFRDQETKARGLQDLKRMFDVPITDQRLVGFYDSDLDLDVEREGWAEERKSQYETTQQLGAAAPQQRMPGGGAGGMGMPGGGGGGRRPPGAGATGMPGEPPTRGPQDFGAGGAGGPLPGSGSRPPVSDEARTTMPNVPITTSYDPDKMNYITVSGDASLDKKVSEKEANLISQKIASLDDEEKEDLVYKTSKYKKAMKEARNPYDERYSTNTRNRIGTFNKTGKKKGTLYFMHGDNMMSVATK